MEGKRLFPSFCVTFSSWNGCFNDGAFVLERCK